MHMWKQARERFQQGAVSYVTRRGSAPDWQTVPSTMVEDVGSNTTETAQCELTPTHGVTEPGQGFFA